MCHIGVYGSARLRVTPGRTRPGTSQAPGAAHTRTRDQHRQPDQVAARSHLELHQPPRPRATTGARPDTRVFARQHPAKAPNAATTAAVTRRSPPPPAHRTRLPDGAGPRADTTRTAGSKHTGHVQPDPSPTRRLRPSPPRVTATSQTGVLNR